MWNEHQFNFEATTTRRHRTNLDRGEARTRSSSHFVMSYFEGPASTSAGDIGMVTSILTSMLTASDILSKLVTLSVSAAEERLGPDAGLGTAALGMLLMMIVFCCSCYRSVSSRRARQNKSSSKPATVTVKKSRAGQVRMCKFCEVEILSKKGFLEAHLAGKRHAKMAGGAKPHECWVWVEKKAEPASAEEQLQAEAEEAAKMAAMAAMDSSESWQTVTSKPRKAKKVGASSDASHNEELEAVRQPGHAASQPKPTAVQGGSGHGRYGRYGHVTHHKKCNDCGKHRDRDGVTVEADPDNEGKGYCLACWERFLHPPEPLQTKQAAEAPPRKHVTHWNR